MSSRRTHPGPAGRLAVDDGGTGPATPVVLVHGNGCRKEQWSEQLMHLRHYRRAVALDFRGFGASAPPDDDDYSVQACASDVIAVVDGLGLGPPVIVGHSYGATVALEVALSQPSRVAGLVLADAPADASRLGPLERARLLSELEPQQYTTRVTDWFIGLLGGARVAVRTEVLETLHRTRRSAFVGALAGMLDYDPTTALAAFAGPKVAVYTSDLNNGPRSLHNIDPSLPRRAMHGVSHWLMMDRPAEFNAHLDELLAQVDR